MSQGQEQFVHNADVQALLRMAQALGSTYELDTLLRMVIDYSMKLLDADRATLFLYDKQKQQLYSRIAEGTGEIRISLNTGFAGAAARDLKVVNVPDAYKDDRFNPEVDKKTGYRTRNILACPLTNYDGQLVGVLQVLNKRNGPFNDKDIAMAEAFAAQAGVALQRAQLLDQYLEKQRLEDSLRIANEIQQRLLPAVSPRIAGFDIACWNQPCDAIGGDYYDFLLLDEHRMMVTLGDVTGHGVGPALISCATRAMLRALFTMTADIEKIVVQVNNLVAADMNTGRFVTAFTGLLNGRDGTLQYCSAGQGPMLWLHADTGRTDILGADSFPMGIMPDLDSMPVQNISLAQNDIFAILTDGFYEWAAVTKELFGTERVIQVITNNKHAASADILHAIKNAVEEFTETRHTDDLTAVIIKRTT